MADSIWYNLMSFIYEVFNVLHCVRSNLYSCIQISGCKFSGFQSFAVKNFIIVIYWSFKMWSPHGLETFCNKHSVKECIIPEQQRCHVAGSHYMYSVFEILVYRWPLAWESWFWELNNIIMWLQMKYYLTVYGALSVASLLLSLLSSSVGQYAGARARRVLHEKMLLNVIRLPLHFFECTPVGRIINRFSTDMSVIDKVSKLCF